MTQDNLLEQDNDQVLIDENKDFFAELVGEGKKFKDEKALAKAKAYSDAHITLLERKMDALSEDYRKAMEQLSAGATLQEQIDKLSQIQQQLTSRETTVTSNEDNQPKLSLDQIESLVTTKIQQTEQQRREKDNRAMVEAKLSEKLGSNYAAILKEKSTKLNLTDDEVNQMARRNPTLFFKTFDLDEMKATESFQSPPKGINTGFAPKGSTHKKWSYYRDLQKKDPQAWTDRSIRLQMEKDALALGEEFYDT